MELDTAGNSGWARSLQPLSHRAERRAGSAFVSERKLQAAFRALCGTEGPERGPADLKQGMSAARGERQNNVHEGRPKVPP